MDALGIIMAYSNNNNLKELVEHRTPASLPIGSRYRLIDFALSNLVNSGITKVGVITHHNYQSLMDHVGNGMDWDLSRKRDGLFIIPPFAREEGMGTETYKGWVDALASSMGFIRRSTNKYVILLPGDYMCNMDYNDVLQKHEASGADITVIYKPMHREKINRSKDIVYSFKNNRLTDITFNPPATEEKQNVSMEMFVMEKDLLEELVRDAAMRGLNSIARDIIARRLADLNFQGYCFEGYAMRAESVNSYMQMSMDLLNDDIRRELFENSQSPIYTKVRDEMPTQYQETAQVRNSIIADGCVIEGEVENCVLFRGVRIEKDAKVSNSILMQNAEVLSAARLENVIMDKNSVVRAGRTLIGQSALPVLVGKHIII